MSLNEWEGMILVKNELTKTRFLPAVRNLSCHPDTLLKGRMLHVLEKNRFGDCLCMVFQDDTPIGLVDVDHDDVRIFIPQRAIFIAKHGFDPEAKTGDLVQTVIEKMEKGEDLTPVVDAILNKLTRQKEGTLSARDLFADMMKGPDDARDETLPDDKPNPASP